jgi:uncharacterized DUF497 family protein
MRSPEWQEDRLKAVDAIAFRSYKKLRGDETRHDWDEAKRTANLRDHRVDFAVIEQFEWDLAIISVDDREDYGELREQAWSFIGDRIYLLDYTQRDETIRVISLRRADQRETRRYAKAIRGRVGGSAASGAARGTRNDRRRRRRD